MKNGFLIGGGLIAVGLVLQLSIGPVAFDALAWPVNGLVLAVLLALIAAMTLLRKRVSSFRFLGSYQAAVPAMAYAVSLTIVMGLTRQKADGSGLHHMLTFWPFVLTYVYMAVILGVTVLRRQKPWAALSHVGLFVALVAATLGSPDIQRVKMRTVVGQPENLTLAPGNRVKAMPFSIELKRFILETYDNGTPRRFASELRIRSVEGDSVDAVVDVNKPYEVDGWKIYQYDYDAPMGADSRSSVLELVHDPWLPLVYAGIYLMLAGAVLMLLRSIPWKRGVKQTRKHPRIALLLCTLVAACFFCVHHFMPILHSDTLVPALQSPWFRPHIIAYMLSYTLMGAAALIAVYLLVSRKFSIVNFQLILIRIGLSFFTIGMLFGALWAKEAWGHYWAWDPKETWAAITWLAYLVYIHYRRLPRHRERVALWMLIGAFVLLQFCWWGINYLPSARETSVHTYNADVRN